MGVPVTAETHAAIPDPAAAADARLAPNASPAWWRPGSAAVVLRHRADLTEEQTAAALGCAVGTVKSRASKETAERRVHPALAHAPEEVHDR